MKWPVEVGQGRKRDKGFLRLEETSVKGQVAVSVAQFGAEIAWKEREVGQRRSLGFAIAEVWEASVKGPVMVRVMAWPVAAGRTTAGAWLQEASILARSSTGY